MDSSPFPQPAAMPMHSPYLNFDPAYLNAGGGPEYILPEGASAKRGRFELAFSLIGSSVMASGAIGGCKGFVQGIRGTGELTGAVRRTQLINYTVKGGTGLANRVGAIAVIYSIFGVVLSQLREKDDEMNTVVAGGLTGLLYKSRAGLKGCGIGGGIGVGLAAAYVLGSEHAKKLL